MPEEKNADTLIEQGDKLMAAGKHDEALKAYEEALGEESENAALYDKLLSAQEKSVTNWNTEDFTKQLHWTMEKQRLENPELERVHEILTPEFKRVTELVEQLTLSPSEEIENAFVKEIQSFGEKAVLPLIEFILKIKHTPPPTEIED